MPELQKLIEQLALADKATEINQLLLSWPEKDQQWAEYVESRIYAPSTTPDYKKDLKEALAQWELTHPQRTASSPSNLQPAQQKVKTNLLQNLELMADSAAEKINALNIEHAAAAHQLIHAVREENLRLEQFQRDHHEYLLSNDPDNTDVQFDDYIAELSFIFGRIEPPAQQHEIEAFEQRCGRPLPASLREFYLCLGGINVSFAHETLSLNIASPAQRLSEATALQPGMGLYQQINNAWGGVREDLSIEQGFDSNLIEQLNQILCVGWFTDGYCEAHAYIIETSPEQYGLFHWHQDYGLSLPEVRAINGRPLFKLLSAAVDVYQHELQAVGYDYDELELDVERLVLSIQ